MPKFDEVKRCIQCGTCSALCPFSKYMNYTPRRIIASYLEEGRIPEEANTLYYCSSCYSCYIQCPRGIPLTDFIYHLRREFGGNPSLYLKFREAVKKKGRIGELTLGINLIFSNIGENLKRLPLYLKLARRR